MFLKDLYCRHVKSELVWEIVKDLYPLILTQMVRFVYKGWIENIVEKGENAGVQYFLLFPQCFQKASSARSLKRLRH